MIREKFFLFTNISYNHIANDGFDGWDYGTNIDQYISWSLGLEYHLNIKNTLHKYFK
jgi:hypothetical protein